MEGFYSVSIAIENTDLSTNGKGASYQYALASAYGEMMERLQNQCNFRLSMDFKPETLQYKYTPVSSIMDLLNLPDFRTEHFIVTQEGCAYRTFIETLLEDNDIKPRSFMKVKNIEAIKQFVISGLGLAILPKIYVEKEVAANLLIELPWNGPDFGMYTQVVYHKDKWLTPSMLSFLELIRSRFQYIRSNHSR